MGARDYDVGTKRMLSPDPIMARPLGIQGRHPYSYVWNQPRNFVDPLGMTPRPPIVESGAALDPPPREPENAGGLNVPYAMLPRAGSNAGGGAAVARGSTPVRREGNGDPQTAQTTGDGASQSHAELNLQQEPGMPTDREITLLILGRDNRRMNGVSVDQIYRTHGPVVASSLEETVVTRSPTTAGDATRVVEGLPSDVRIRNVVFVGHGGGSEGSGSGQFAFVFGTTNNSMSLRAPGAGHRASDRFWNAVGSRIASGGRIRVQFHACHVGRDPAFLSSVANSLAASGDEGTQVTATGYRDYYAVGLRNGETRSLEVESRAEASRYLRRGGGYLAPMVPPASATASSTNAP